MRKHYSPGNRVTFRLPIAPGGQLYRTFSRKVLAVNKDGSLVVQCYGKIIIRRKDIIDPYKDDR